MFVHNRPPWLQKVSLYIFIFQGVSDLHIHAVDYLHIGREHMGKGAIIVVLNVVLEP